MYLKNDDANIVQDVVNTNLLFKIPCNAWTSGKNDTIANTHRSGIVPLDLDILVHQFSDNDCPQWGIFFRSYQFHVLYYTANIKDNFIL
jgi:hypothetical protein